MTPEEVRIAILDDTAAWIEAQSEAALVVPGVRDAIYKRVVDDLTDVFQSGRAAATTRTSRDVAEQARVYLRPVLAEAGMGDTLRTLVYCGKRAALHRLNAPEALADLSDAASTHSEVSDLVDRIVLGTESEITVPTGLVKLDSVMNGGMPRGELTLLGAATGAGKTAFSMQVAEVAARHDKGVVLVCSPEMRAANLRLRSAQRESEVPRRELKRGHPNRDDALVRITEASSRAMARTNLKVLDRVDADIHAAIEAAYLMHETHGLYLLVLDYAQQLATEDPKQPRYLEVAKVARTALKFAEDTNAAVLLTSQINESKDKSGNVTSRTFRESNTIEHKAAVAMMMQVRKDENIAEVLFTKNRDGAQPMIKLMYRAEIFRFDNLAEDEPQRFQGWEDKL